MFYTNKPFLQSLFIFALFLLPMTKAASDDLTQQVNQLQAQMTTTNEKIASLASDLQRITGTISALQTGLNTAHQETSDLKNSGVYKDNQSVETNVGFLRTANGHGRGGR
ncbi:hypothetical protein [Methyloglobulus sp.]|uniref:hypothetical protein n=1 Tax=Methyloglobulus sp. TaxID=2518622 RepID=UPI003989392D